MGCFNINSNILRGSCVFFLPVAVYSAQKVGKSLSWLPDRQISRRECYKVLFKEHRCLWTLALSSTN
jgi:hypothetical protein